ncbi:MAG: HEAT repeat domain-containing protein [Candidatus Sumerlaeota bacterium]
MKIEAIRALARTRSPEVAERVLNLLTDPDRQYLADEAAWALGELEWQPAVEALIERLDERWRPGIRAMSARALGKIGDERAIDPLAEMVRTERRSLHTLSSACRALLRLGAQEKTHYIFRALAHLEHRADCYELLDVLCHMIDISNEWLLRPTTPGSPRESLLSFVNLQSPGWQAEHGVLIEMLQETDLDALRRQFRTVREAKKDTLHPLVEELAKTLDGLERWQPLAVLATAWLMLHGES